MADSPPGLAIALGVSTVALLLLRGLVAALEAALVAVGMPRAQERAASPGAGRAARALEALLADPEATAFTLRLVGAGSLLLAGLLSAFLGAALAPGRAWAAGALVALGAGFLSMPVAAAWRGVGAAHGEGVGLALAVPFRALRVLLRPLARAVAFVAGRGARFSLPPPPLDEMERTLTEYARSHGTGTEATGELIRRVFELREKVARDVMVQRTDVVALELETPVPEIIRLLAEEGHSRMPVYRDTLDQIVGVLHARDLVPLLAHPDLIVLADLLRPAHFVPWSKPVEQLLGDMQRRKLHMAFVVDEFGGVMGLCTIEDVLEQIVGEIRDEYEEEDTGRDVEAHADGTFTALGAAPVAEFNRVAGADLPEDRGYETVAGFLNAVAGAIPAKGDRFFWRGWAFTVVEADPRRVTRVRAARVPRPG
ncbi:MAG TPA: hemolysin family protein [Anaeromyxobacteraceae bacterium]|nr:hemolysin family protein [Anaeromyxobacteraceae bacterium]